MSTQLSSRNVNEEVFFGQSRVVIFSVSLVVVIQLLNWIKTLGEAFSSEKLMPFELVIDWNTLILRRFAIRSNASLALNFSDSKLLWRTEES